MRYVKAHDFLKPGLTQASFRLNGLFNMGIYSLAVEGKV